jgi:hypothetical protein
MPKNSAGGDQDQIPEVDNKIGHHDQCARMERQFRPTEAMKLVSCGTR